MESLSDRLATLSESHRHALAWFAAHAGTVQSWPLPLVDGETRLVTQAKGIYKPAGIPYALSVRQTLDSSYGDHDPVYHDDGAWTYLYHQEGDGVADLERLFTNRGLTRCQRDGVPVGVLRQTKGKPGAQYEVLGVALVVDWRDGFFRLEGFSPDGMLHTPASKPITEAELSAVANELEALGEFDPTNDGDRRDWVMAAIVRRRGQAAFRQHLLEAYAGRCAITGCDAVAALEAAHIVPYRGPSAHHPANGLLLRTDLHALFDLGLLGIDEETMTVVLAPSLRATTYADLEGRPVFVPATMSQRPNPTALRLHRGAMATNVAGVLTGREDKKP